jgi:2-aminophenol/2-amino-5-chlorophenol 1,6-dioxygenase alpha subunit
VIVTPPSAFSISWASALVFIAVAGGMGTVAGPVVGAIVYILVDRVIAAAAGQGLLVLGLLSILLMLLLPRGVMGIVHDLRQPARRRRGPSQWQTLRRLLLGESARAEQGALADQPGVVGAYLVTGSPLLALARKEPGYRPLLDAYAKVARDIDALEPDTLVIYSTRWYAVLDQLWQARARVAGLHVDENWHELGEMRYDMTTDVSLARACVRAANRAGIRSKGVDYQGFPIDSGTLVAQALSNPDGRFPSLVVANNLYHDAERTRVLGELVAAQAVAQGKRVVVLAVGELSGGQFRDARALADDAIASPTDDEWNRRMLALIEARDLDELQRQLPDYLAQAKVDMGFKHFAFALGALGGRLGEVEVYGYGPQYGAGAAVVRLA